MSQISYKKLTTGISKEMQGFGKNQPEVMGAFSKMAQAAGKDGVLDAKTKEYVALGITYSYMLIFRGYLLHPNNPTYNKGIAVD